MFRLMKLRPPHGWNAVVWELAIVTLGVLIALAAQEWAENLSWNSKVAASKKAIRAELAEHYNYAVEFRTVYPCLKVQLDRLRARVLTSGAMLDPAPLYEDAGHDDFVLRVPGKFYPTDAWEEAINDGVVQRFEPAVRRQLAGLYAQIVPVQAMNAANSEGEIALVALSHPMPLDPSVRYSTLREIEQLNGRLQYLDGLNGQIIDYIQHVRMVPPSRDARAVTERYGTYKFCKAHGLPMRPFKEAMQAIPN